MNSWIDLHALWKIIVVGLLAGAGGPALFAVGIRALSMPGSRGVASADQVYGGNLTGLAAATVCFLIVLAAIAWGIYSVVNG